MLNCAIVCLIAFNVNIRSSRKDSACAYCVDSRSTHEDCFENVIDCAYRDPKGILFCMNFYESEPSREFTTRTTRCISYYDLYIKDDAIRAIAENGVCDFPSRQFCDCSDVCSGRNVTNDGWPYEMTTMTPRPRIRTTTSTTRHIAEMKVTTPTLTESEPGVSSISFFEKTQNAIRELLVSVSGPANGGSSMACIRILAAVALLLLIV